MMSFVHMSGAGNTFLVADAREETSTWSADRVRSVLSEHPRPDHAPIEGLLLLRSCNDDAVVADFYNPDGTHGMMCGNGARCIVRFACDHGLVYREKVNLTINGMVFRCSVSSNDLVSITFPAPTTIRHYPIGTLEGIGVDVWYVNVGTDHVVIDGPINPERPEVLCLRHHRQFANGTNVNMFELGVPRHLATFERGVESVTGACGTGALSCAVVAWKKNPAAADHTFIPPSGRKLEVHLEVVDSEIVSMTLTGDALYDNI